MKSIFKGKNMNSDKKILFGMEKDGNKKKFLFFGIPLFRIVRTDSKRTFDLFNIRILKKERYKNGRRHIYLFGMKIFSYERKHNGGLMGYPIRVYDEYHRLKDKIKELKNSK